MHNVRASNSPIETMSAGMASSSTGTPGEDQGWFDGLNLGTPNICMDIYKYIHIGKL